MTTRNEEEFFALEEAEKMRRLSKEARQALAAEERQRLKTLHFMRCPKCGMEMSEMKVAHLAVLACFACNGVFLDKGEIDVIAHPKQKGIMAAILNWFS